MEEDIKGLQGDTTTTEATGAVAVIVTDDELLLNGYLYK
jgi:hypothetical protein